MILRRKKNIYNLSGVRGRSPRKILNINSYKEFFRQFLVATTTKNAEMLIFSIIFYECRNHFLACLLWSLECSNLVSLKSMHTYIEQALIKCSKSSSTLKQFSNTLLCFSVGFQYVSFPLDMFHVESAEHILCVLLR